MGTTGHWCRYQTWGTYMFESKNVLNSFSPIEGRNIAREFSSLDSSLAHSLQTDVSDFRSTTLLFDRDRALSKEE